MPAHRSTLRRLFFSLVVCSLLCGIVSAELPELLSLTDNTSNDFTIRKANAREYTPRLSTRIHESPLYAKNFECSARTRFEPTFVGAERISSNLFVLHSVLRR